MTMHDRLTAEALLPAVISAVEAEWASIHGHTGETRRLDAQSRVGGATLPADSLALLRLAAAVGNEFGLADQGIDDYLLRRRTLGEWADLATLALDRPKATVRFSTSGSTGTPKTHVHAMDGLWQEARWLADNLPAFKRVYSVAPAHHIYGFLFGVVLPLAAATPVIHAPGPQRWQPDRIQTGDLVVGFPTFWSHLAATGRQLPSTAVGVSSTSPLPAGVASTVAGSAGFIEVFGSSETAGLGMRRAPDGSFHLMDHWRRAGQDGLQRLMPDGSWHDHPGPDDALEWVDERRFVPAGRRDGAVQIGGINVYPAAVARQIEAHPGVAACVVRAGGGPSDRLKAFVVPGSQIDEAALDGELRSWFEHHLTPAERPGHLTFGPALPRSPMGKLQDW